MKISPILLKDGYKVGHKFQYPEGTTLVYSNLTPRKSRVEGSDHIVFFGLQYFIKEYLMHQFDAEFFKQPKAEVLKLAEGEETRLMLSRAPPGDTPQPPSFCQTKIRRVIVPAKEAGTVILPEAVYTPALDPPVNSKVAPVNVTLLDAGTPAAGTIVFGAA